MFNILNKQSKYFDKIKSFSTKGVVIEDNIWYFGKPKEKAKVNIPTLLPLQEPSEITKFIKKASNIFIKDSSVQQTRNYIEIYLPDSLYTYPSEGDVENENPKIRGASKNNKKRTANNGETKEGLVREVKKNTEIMLFFIDGKVEHKNIKILGRYDDFDEEAALQYSNYGNKLSSSAKQSGTRYGSAKR